MSEQPREGTRIEVANDELRTVREAMRGLNRMLAAFAEGRASKFVLTRSGKMVAVLRPIEDDCDPAPPRGEGVCDGCGAEVLPARIHECPSTPPGRASTSTFRPAQPQPRGEEADGTLLLAIHYSGDHNPKQDRFAILDALPVQWPSGALLEEAEFIPAPPRGEEVRACSRCGATDAKDRRIIEAGPSGATYSAFCDNDEFHRPAPPRGEGDDLAARLEDAATTAQRIGAKHREEGNSAASSYYRGQRNAYNEAAELARASTHPEQSERIVGAALDLLDSLGAPHYHDLIGMTYTLRKEQADNLRAALEPASPTPTAARVIREAIRLRDSLDDLEMGDSPNLTGLMDALDDLSPTPTEQREANEQ